MLPYTAAIADDADPFPIPGDDYDAQPIFEAAGEAWAWLADECYQREGRPADSVNVAALYAHQPVPGTVRAEPRANDGLVVEYTVRPIEVFYAAGGVDTLPPDFFPTARDAINWCVTEYSTRSASTDEARKQRDATSMRTAAIWSTRNVAADLLWPVERADTVSFTTHDGVTYWVHPWPWGGWEQA